MPSEKFDCDDDKTGNAKQRQGSIDLPLRSRREKEQKPNEEKQRPADMKLAS
ncbi:hypothetical protein [Rhizobium mongolense]|uniref:hypothetical protein n=1 Tax=Rhizobium mongolense TaxID=57676 RepID=UPI001428B39E|nr:hypothetical protein [Rhizobium mongolense]